MIWLNALALVGLAGIVLPVLIHLLARGRAKTYRFPSLRFIDPSQLLPTRRTRVQDPLLLALRCTIVGLAAFALAQPVFLTARRKRAIEQGVARAIVVDTSASMQRSTPSGISALDSSRRAARAMANDAQASIIIETNDPARATSAASSWLTDRRQSGDLAIISDFQRGQLDSNDVKTIPAEISVTLHRIPVVNAPVVETHWMAGDRRISVRATPRGELTDAEWTTSKESTERSAVTLLDAETNRSAVDATRIAAATAAVPERQDSSRAVSIVFPGYVDRRTTDTTAQAAYAPWMADLLRRINARGNDVSKATVTVVGNRRELLLFTDSAPASLASVRIVAAARAAVSAGTALTELEPETLSEREVASLARPARSGTTPRSSDPNGESDARWFWAVVLVLLVIEVPLRRMTPRRDAAAVEERARAA